MILWTLIIIYFLSLFVIFFYSLLQATLGLKYIKASKRIASNEPQLDEKNIPRVTIQLPVYNEKYVVERLLDKVAEIDYPIDKFEIQVLDDSTDETTDIIRKKIAELKEKNIDIKLILRDDRAGFKAGALKNAMGSVKGEFIAIFDADFLPEKNFLKRTVPYFKDENIGVVQTRWEHVNREYSLLTKLQAFALDAHFSVEQVGRSFGDHYINFNGTAGIWRKKTIEDGGGWSNDTLTEDLDLSYRSQLKGWKFIYLENLKSPAELPIAMSALKSQQFRWTKGGAETFKKMSGKLLFQKGLKLTNRIHGLAHLFNSSVFIFVLLLGLISVPMVFLIENMPQYEIILDYTSIFFISTLFLIFYYWLSYRERYENKGLKIIGFIRRFIQFLTVTMGLSYYNTQAVTLAYFGKKTPFVRTPKFNLTQKKNQQEKNTYLLSEIKFSTLVEGLLALYFLSAIIFEIYHQMYGMVTFHILLFFGFAIVFGYTLVEKLRK